MINIKAGSAATSLKRLLKKSFLKVSSKCTCPMDF